MKIPKFTKLKNILKHEKKLFLKRFSKHLILYSVILLIFYFMILYMMFFVFQSHVTEKPITKNHMITNLSEIKNSTYLKAYLDKDSLFAIQPINVIIITKPNVKLLFNKIGWEENLMFSTSNISLKKYYYLLKNKTLPISNLYVDGRAQDYAFQEKSNSNFDRNHVRLWKIGYLNSTNQTIYIATISYDNGIEFTFYRDFLVPLHEFNPNIDKSRNVFLEQFLKKYPPKNYYYVNWGTKISKRQLNDNLNYYTDGAVLIMNFTN